MDSGAGIQCILDIVVQTHPASASYTQIKTTGADHVPIWLLYGDPHIKFFKEGRWRYVHVDDTIPCDMAGKPLFSKSSNPNAVWIMILEKAYAKVGGECWDAPPNHSHHYAFPPRSFTDATRPLEEDTLSTPSRTALDSQV